MNDALGRLAEAAGIEARYWDIAGRLREISPDTARLLLAALGYPGATEAEALESLAQLEEAPWRETLPPVVIAAQEQEIVIPLRLPAVARGCLRWKIDLESGVQASGEAAIADLEVEAGGACNGRDLLLRRLRLPAQPSGYHHVHVEGTTDLATQIVVAPPRCHLPPHDRRYWGIATQLYAMRSQDNWGIGDFTDLRTLIEWAGANGAAAVAVNPLHALFVDTPQEASPYSPSSRLFLNPLYLDVTAIADFAESAEARAGASSNLVRMARAAEFVDYPIVAAAKLAVLEQLYAHFCMAHGSANDIRGQLWRKFVADGGRDLHQFSTFQTLSERFGTHNWHAWPQSWRQPVPPERLPRDLLDRTGFFKYLQWQCALQLSAAAEAGRSMAIGLCNDLSVGVATTSSDHWANQELFLSGVRVGAPPDPFNEKGQEWGVVPFNPRRLRATGYAHFIALLRANMRDGGALRVDHVMGWQRLFLIPEGASPSEGAYLRFPLDDLLAIAALESRRKRCLTIGEDLGTAPAGLRERMAATGLLSCRVLYFEHDDAHFRSPHEIPQSVTVSVGTHDLATLRGYWTAEDIAAKARLGILTGGLERQARDERSRDKHLLLQALAEEGLCPPLDDAPWTPQLADAIHAYLARSPALLFMVQLDDLIHETHQVNLPGSIADIPNWRRRLGQSLEEMATNPTLAQSMAVISRERGP